MKLDIGQPCAVSVLARVAAVYRYGGDLCVDPTSREYLHRKMPWRLGKTMTRSRVVPGAAAPALQTTGSLGILFQCSDRPSQGEHHK